MKKNSRECQKLLLSQKLKFSDITALFSACSLTPNFLWAEVAVAPVSQRGHSHSYWLSGTENEPQGDDGLTWFHILHHSFHSISIILFFSSFLNCAFVIFLKWFNRFCGASLLPSPSSLGVISSSSSSSHVSASDFYFMFWPPSIIPQLLS